jgi:hypothetical protein
MASAALVVTSTMAGGLAFALVATCLVVVLAGPHPPLVATPALVVILALVALTVVVVVVGALSGTPSSGSTPSRGCSSPGRGPLLHSEQTRQHTALWCNGMVRLHQRSRCSLPGALQALLQSQVTPVIFAHVLQLTSKKRHTDVKHNGSTGGACSRFMCRSANQ